MLVLVLVVPALAAAGWMLVRAWRGRIRPGGERSLGRTDAAPDSSQTRVLRPNEGRAADARGAGPAMWALRVVLVLACGLLLLRPGLPGGEMRALATDTDVVVVIDTTASMVAEDWAGEPRMDGVRDDVRTIIETYPGARFALITFAASAELRLPLTTDASALVSAVDVLIPEVTRQSRGSSIGVAAPLLAEILGRAAASSPERARMVFYLGDGEQTVSSSPESFAAASTTVDGGGVLGYGTAQGGPMRETTGDPDDRGDYIEYQGERALSVIDEDALRAIADQLGVDYTHRTADDTVALPEAPATTTAYREDGTTRHVNDLSWILALVIVILLCLEIARASMLIARMRGLAVRAPLPSGAASPPAWSSTSPPASPPGVSAKRRLPSETTEDSHGLGTRSSSRGEGGTP
nr:VWA domain-containing protein [Microbacterium pseudoresistens]